MILDCTKKNLADGYPELVKEWSDKNGDLKPDKVTYGSNKIVWWKGNCGHEWKMSVKSRTMGQGCPYCAGVRVLIGDNDLATICPHLADEWSDKNEDYKPTDFTAGSSKKVWWKCKEGHEWEAVIKNRVNGSTCPYCSHRKVLAGVNDLATVRPKLALDWSPRNGKLKADMVSEFSNRKVWWKCHVCGYELMQQDDSLIGVGLEFYCKELNVAVILSRPFHETIHGHRIENAKNDLCRKNNIRLIRILEAGCRTYDNCMCLQCNDESLESYDWVLISLFEILGIAMNVDCERDM